MPSGYRLEFHIAGGHSVTTWLSLEDVEEMRRSGTYVAQGEVADDTEFRRLIVRTRLGYLTGGDADGHLVVNNEAGAEWVIPMRSVIAATWSEQEAADQPRRFGFAPPGRLGTDVPIAPFTVLPGGRDPDD